MWSTRPGLINQARNSVSNFDLAPGFSCSFSNSTPDFCLTPVSPCMFTQESPCSLLWLFVVLLFRGGLVWCGFLLFMQETLSKAAQADLCIFCVNGGSTPCKNFSATLSFEKLINLTEPSFQPKFARGTLPRRTCGRGRAVPNPIHQSHAIDSSRLEDSVCPKGVCMPLHHTRCLDNAVS